MRCAHDACVWCQRGLRYVANDGYRYAPTIRAAAGADAIEATGAAVKPAMDRLMRMTAEKIGMIVGQVGNEVKASGLLE